MKRLITFLLALMLTWIGANAQSYYVDYSSKMSTATTDWSVASGTFRTGVEYYNDTATNFSGLDMSQTITGLPAGTYTVSFYAAVNEANSSKNNQSGTEFKAYVQDATVTDNYKTGTVGTLSAAGIAWGAGGFATPYTFTVTLTEGQSLKYGISNTGNGGNWAVIQPVSLLLAVESQTSGDLVHDCLPIAGPVLNDAADRWWPLNWSSSSSSTAVGNFHVNTWSTEGNSDGSGMTTPFIEYWFGSGTNVADAVLSHETLTGLTPGLYEVSVLARAYNENSTTAVGAGITFNANGQSVDLTTGTTGTTGSSTEVYGTYTLVAEVKEAGTLDINFTIQSETSCDWLAWKDLKVVYDGESLPDLTYVTGDMNATVEATMKAAVDAYNSSKSTDDYTTALAAIEAAEESAAQYAEIAALVANLDTDGATVWAATTSGQAYTAKTLTTSDDITDDMVAAQRAQTSANTDWSYVVKNTGTWVNAIKATNFQACPSLPTAHEIWSGSAWSLPSGATSAEAIYKRIEDLPAGEYTISFYAYGNAEANASRPLAFANDKETEVAYASALAWSESSLYTLTCEVGYDGELDFGMKTQGNGNWYVMEEYSLTLVKLAEGIEAGEKVHSCEAEFDHWTISGNSGGSFQRNTWSTEADPSGLVTPFIEYWVGSGNQLSDATISHTQLTDLTAGYYEVSIFARAFNENSLVDVAEGITFTANKESIDLNKETHATYNHVSAEEYGTYKVYCQVADDGKLDINFKLSNANCDWLAFKNLAVTYMGSSLTDLPELTAATGTMNSSIASAQSTALAAYNAEGGATLDNYNAAYQAVECARVSAEFYAGIAEALSQLDDYLDDAGKKWLNANETITAYNAQSLSYQDMYGVYMGAVKQQTTIGIDLTEAMESTGAWTAEQGNGPGSYSSGLATETYIESGEATEGEVLYYMVTGLSTDVYYTVSFYVAANMANSVSGDSGSDISQAYANDKTIDITVGTNSGAQITSLNDMTLISISCAADEDGVLEFGIQNVAAGGNWFLCAPASLAIAGSVEDVADDCDYEKGVNVTVTVDDEEITYTVVGENLFKNGGFNNGVLDWTAGSGYTNDLSILNVTYNTEGGYNNGPFLTLKSSVGAANAATPTQAIAVEAGKTYLFVGYTSGSAPTDANKRYSALFEMSDATTEENHDESGTSYSNTLIELEWGDTGWTQTIGVFTVPAASEEGTYSYVGMRMNWSTGSYDGFQLYEVEEVTEETIEWTMTEARWGTLILPFAVEAVPSGLTMYAGSALSLDSEGTTITVGTASETIEANTPYLVEGTDAKTYEFTGVPTNTENTYTVGLLTGTLVDLSQEEGTLTTDGTEYVLQNHDGEVAFYPITSESEAVTLDAYHCYLTGVTGAALHLPGMATGIVAVEGAEAEANGAIYDLSGRRVPKAVKGVYIQNGKKVLVK